jgi:hypothetical protein
MVGGWFRYLVFGSGRGALEHRCVRHGKETGQEKAEIKTVRCLLLWKWEMGKNRRVG